MKRNVIMTLTLGAVLGLPGAVQAHESEATKALKAANGKVHEVASIVLTGDPDVDFVMSMMAHHQGAIDMAEVVLKYGTDPKIRALAKSIVRTEQGELDLMRQWIETDGGRL